MLPRSMSLLSRLCFEWRSVKRCFANRNILELSERDFLQQIFPDTAGPTLKKLFAKEPQTFYAGFDPTANSLHVGNLLVILGLLHCQRAGHRPIALIGGATGLIGDPSGRKSERSKIGAEVVEENVEAIEKQLQQIFQNHEDCLWNTKRRPLSPLRIVNNADWYADLNVVEFVAEVGRHFRMGDLLAKTSVQTRLESEAGMSFTEFTYQIFQAYDWLHLYRKYKCRFQVGGSDQMGNLKSGYDLITRLEKENVYGVTLPLVTNEEGDKFGKSAGNAVWLDSSKTSPFALYQYFIRKPDSEVEKLLKLFTFIPMAEVQQLMTEHWKDPEKRKAQTLLAEDVTLLVHGEKGLKQAERITEALYKGSVESLGELDYADLRSTFVGATVVELLAEPGISVLQLAMKAKCFPTESDAMRIITAGGFYVNQKRVQNITEVIMNGIHILKNGISLLRVGKKNFYIVRWLK